MLGRIALVVVALASFHLSCRTAPSASATLSEPAQPHGASRPSVQLLNNRSPWFSIANEADLGFVASYSAFIPEAGQPNGGRRVRNLNIGKKALDMIARAKTTIVGTVFLFDSLYAKDPENTASHYMSDGAEAMEERRITEAITDALIKKKREQPAIKIVLILDPINRAYVDRRSPAVTKLHEAGIDVFFSDLLVTPAVGANNPLTQAFHKLHEANVHVEALDARALEAIAVLAGHAAALQALIEGRLVDWQRAVLDLAVGRALEVGGEKLSFDGERISLEMAFNVALLKANHRKLLVTDDGDTYEAMIASGNPHDASFGSANFAVTARGDIAKHIYNVMREDVRQCLKRYGDMQAVFGAEPERAQRYARRFALLGKDRERQDLMSSYMNTELPEFGGVQTGGAGPIRAQFVTETAIADAIIEQLAQVEADDEVRIQMFYLSYQPVLDAILEAGKRVNKPIRLILDPNKDAFNKIKDGTPNRQVARYLKTEAAARGAKLDIRWYVTHGEQNHAKIMTIGNRAKGRYRMINGSGNWTGKNLTGANMESNVVIEGAGRLNQEFDRLFDEFWNNTPPSGVSAIEYTCAYDDDTHRFHTQVADDSKWRDGEQGGLVSW